MNKRETCYVCGPENFDLKCPNNPDHKITWSEYEQHIWCYDCKKDIKYEPCVVIVPWNVARIIGIDYRQYNVKTGEIIEPKD